MWDPRVEGALNSFPLRIDWQLATSAGKAPERSELPAPEVAARPVRPGDPVPASAARLRDDMAELCRGRVRMSYSRGPRVTNAGRSNEKVVIVDVVVVHAWTSGIAAVAIWRAGKLDTALIRKSQAIPEPASKFAVVPPGGKVKETAVAVVKRVMADAVRDESDAGSLE